MIEEKKMSILEVKILATVLVTGLFLRYLSLLKGEHIGLVGANGGEINLYEHCDG